MLKRGPGTIKNLLQNDVGKSSQQKHKRSLQYELPASVLEEIVSGKKNDNNDVSVPVTKVRSKPEVVCQRVIPKRHNEGCNRFINLRKLIFSKLIRDLNKSIQRDNKQNCRYSDRNVVGEVFVL